MATEWIWPAPTGSRLTVKATAIWLPSRKTPTEVSIAPSSRLYTSAFGEKAGTSDPAAFTSTSAERSGRAVGGGATDGGGGG
eukprot:9492886-Pyramimonas_sp.AAC.1